VFFWGPKLIQYIEDKSYVLLVVANTAILMDEAGNQIIYKQCGQKMWDFIAIIVSRPKSPLNVLVGITRKTEHYQTQTPTAFIYKVISQPLWLGSIVERKLLLFYAQTWLTVHCEMSSVVFRIREVTNPNLGWLTGPPEQGIF
jgi:hypothetical protein